MIQKGIVKELLLNENRVLVRIPMYESPGNGEAIFDCMVSNQPGIINGYTVGDVVFVDFENNDLDDPVVVGNLYRGLNEMKSKSGFVGDSINVAGSSKFSTDFQVGEITYKDLLALKKALPLIDEIKVDGGEIT